MTAKRFIEFATQQTDNGKINNGFQDIMTGEWHYTKDSENAKKICELLNELHEENQSIKKHIGELYKYVKIDVDNEIEVYPRHCWYS